MAKLSNAKRGRDLMVVGWLAVAMGLAVSRWILMDRLGLPWEVVRDMRPGVAPLMNLELVPDGIFAALAFLIIYIRFR